MNNEISDNLDLRAADIFGDSRNLREFERQLNDPELQISNLDLNNDNEVDYLRVIETVDNRTHVVIIQSVLDREVYQDVATIEIEKTDIIPFIYKLWVMNTCTVKITFTNPYYNTPLIYNSFGPIITDRMYQTGIGIIIHHTIMPGILSCVPIQKQYSS
jgi:hypothetical protein